MFIIYLVVSVLAFIFYVKWKLKYWQRRGVPTIQPEFLFGNFREVVSKKTSFGEWSVDYYKNCKKFTSQHAGAYHLLSPIYIPIDPALIKLIFQKDFGHFMNRGLYHHPKDVLTMSLVNMEGDKWKELRAKLTPTFTSGKMKMMFETLLQKTEGLEKSVAKYAVNHETFSIKEVLARFSTDVIGSVAFGIECNSQEEPDTDFRKYSNKIFEPKPLQFLLTTLVPWPVLGYLGYKASGKEPTKFFTNIVKETIKFRETNDIYRKDFMHLILQLRNQGVVSDSTKVTGNKENKIMTEDEIVAQCVVFFLAGFETSSTTMTFALLQLAQRPDIQQKLRDEINKVLQKHDGKITYDAVMDMAYLERVINETLRLTPPGVILPRVCNKEYKVPNSDVVIEKGTKIFIPVWGIHMDPEYYPKPEVFEPDRFTEENKATRPDFTFLPFGEGPRMCIGLRFGMLQSKVGLISLIRNFKFTLNKKTVLPITMEPGARIITAKGGIWLDAVKI